MEINENLVRENGNQAAAVMADYAGGGGVKLSEIEEGGWDSFLPIGWRKPTTEEIDMFPGEEGGYSAVLDVDPTDPQIPVTLIVHGQLFTLLEVDKKSDRTSVRYKGSEYNTFCNFSQDMTLLGWVN